MISGDAALLLFEFYCYMRCPDKVHHNVLF